MMQQAIASLLLAAAVTATSNPKDAKSAWDHPSEEVDQYDGQSSEWFPKVQNTSDPKAWRDSFMAIYARSYMHFLHGAEALPKGPDSVKDAKTLDDLKKWLKAQKAQIKAFVPKEYQEFALHSAEKKFAVRKAEIMEAEEAEKAEEAPTNSSDTVAEFLLETTARPMKDEDESDRIGGFYRAQYLPQVQNTSDAKSWRDAFMKVYAKQYMHFVADKESIEQKFPNAPEDASDAKTHSQLKEWRDAQMARIKAFVPEGYRQTAKANVESEYRSHEASMEKAAAKVPQDNTTDNQKGAPAALTAIAMPVGVPLVAVAVACLAFFATASAIYFKQGSSNMDAYLLQEEA